MDGVKALTDSEAFFVLNRLPSELKSLVTIDLGGQHLIRMPTTEEVRAAEEWKEQLDLAAYEQQIMDGGEQRGSLEFIDGRMQQLSFEQTIVYDTIKKAMSSP